MSVLRSLLVQSERMDCSTQKSKFKGGGAKKFQICTHTPKKTCFMIRWLNASAPQRVSAKQGTGSDVDAVLWKGVKKEYHVLKQEKFMSRG